MNWLEIVGCGALATYVCILVFVIIAACVSEKHKKPIDYALEINRIIIIIVTAIAAIYKFITG